MARTTSESRGRNRATRPLLIAVAIMGFSLGTWQLMTHSMSDQLVHSTTTLLWTVVIFGLAASHR